MSMLRRPDAIEIIVFSISVAVVAVSAREFAKGTVDQAGMPLVGLAPLLIGIGVAVLLGHTFFARPGLRYVSHAVHFVYVCGVPALLGWISPIAPAALTATFIYQSGLRLGPGRAAIASGAAVVAMLVIGVAQYQPLSELVLSMGILVMLSFASGLSVKVRDDLVRMKRVALQQRRSLDSLEAANTSFLEHLTSVEEDSAERERQRITRELHDSIGYGMTNIAMMMNAAQYLIRSDPGKLAEYCERTREMANTTLQDARSTLYDLRNVVL